MQRWLFFIFCLCSVSLLRGQSINITTTEISMWFAGPQASSDTHIIKALALVSFTGLLSTQGIELEGRGFRVTHIKLKEGREKGQLTYRLENGKIHIELPVEIGKKYEIVIDYTINLKHELTDNYTQQTSDLLVINPFNARESINMGEAGIFYPSLSGDESILVLNVTMLKKMGIGFRGAIEFETDNQDGTKSQYWRSERPISPEGFYLVMGEFKEFEAEDLEEEFELSAVELRKIKIFNAKKDMMTAIEFVGLKPEALSDSEFAFIDSLSNLRQPGFFITGGEPNLGITNRDLNRVKALALYTNSNDTVKASREVYNLLIQENGKSWEEEVMDWKWQRLETLSKMDGQKVLKYRLERWRNGNPELFAVMNSSETDTALFESMLTTFEFPDIAVSYRYVARDTALYVSYVHDTSKAPMYFIPVEVNFTTDEGTFKKVKKLTAVTGELKIKSEKIPKVASVNFGHYFPGKVEEKKPDTYLLYQLSQAQTTEERKEALLGLFKTSNPNLFSTALGIAMRDSDDELKLLALKNADKLNVPAQQKLRSAIEQLARDSSGEISTLAESLVKKYYGDK